MTDASPPPDLEPFGQRSARVYVRAALLFFCAVAVVLSALMLVRSASYYDGLTLISHGRRVEVASAIDRLIFLVGEPRPDDVESNDWVPRSFMIDDVADAWQPSWQKTLGLQFGMEPDPTAGRDGATAWRMRVRWRTLIIAYMLPLIVTVVRRRVGRPAAAKVRRA